MDKGSVTEVTPHMRGELKLKAVITGLQSVWKYLLRHWKIILAGSLIGGVCGFTYAHFKKPVYKALLTFALEEKGGAMGGYASIASQMGIDLGAGMNASGGAFVGENLLELLKSRLLIEKTLLSEVNLSGRKEMLVNRYIHFNGLDTKWEKEPALRVTFLPDQPRERFTLPQDSVLFRIYDVIVKHDLLLKKVDKKLNIVEVQFLSQDQLFAKAFVEELVRIASEFYVETKTRKTRANVFLLQERVDSVKAALDNQMYGAAVTQDQNQNLSRAKGRIGIAKQQLNVQILTTMYGELVKNLELSKFTLMREEPLIQVIDRPIFPLEKKKPGRIRYTIVCAVLGAFCISVCLLTARVYRKLIQIESNEQATTY